ncbi:melatonin receptor type 1B-B-like [Convolutriloba macropyga]|uniref:melatonin receptor type 1B-B-like n=1 Tax=Convolutriloba macropyga TaxID=536237 RepID=UPI003F51C90E
MPASANNVAKGSERRQKEQRQLVISLMTVFVAFVITWTPLGIIIALIGIKVDTSPFIPFEMIIFIDLWAHLNSAVNFIIYGMTHRGFRRAYIELFFRALPCLKPGEKLTGTSSGVTGSRTLNTSTQM